MSTFSLVISFNDSNNVQIYVLQSGKPCWISLCLNSGKTKSQF